MITDVAPHMTENLMEDTSESKDSVAVEDVEPFTCTDEAERNAVRESSTVDYVERDCTTIDYAATESTAIDYATLEATTIDDEILEPYIGMEFESEQSTYSFYNEYAKRVGFGIRKRFIRRSRTNNEVICRTYVCSREGLKKPKKEVDNPRPNTRLDCKAMMQVKKNGNGKWVMIQFVEEHNHALNPQSVCFFRSQKIKTLKENVIRTPTSSALQVSKIMSTKKSRAVKNLGVMDKDCRRIVNKEQRESLSAVDAQIIYEYFMRTQVSNPRFLYAMELDEEQRLRNVFWADTKSRIAYSHFGDVVTFDTTYLTNKYATRLAMFVGVNHHRQPVLLGCALVTDETKASFTWVFKTWLTVMQGRPPKAIVTDRHSAIKAAISEVFPETRHRLCLWHIMNGFPEKLGNLCKIDVRIMLKFDKCIYDSLTADQFEKRWKSLIETWELTNHEWVQALFEDRRQWVPLYLKDTFFAGMSISQRNERMHSFFEEYVSQKTSLKEFLDHYELALQKRYNDEEKADVETYHNTPELKTGSPYESQLASIYTMDIFKRFQDEILQILLCNAVQLQQEGTNATYVVKELVVKSNGKRGIKEYTVLWNGAETTISCICHLFEFKGYLCRHAMVVLFAVGVYEIPSHYILKRWTRDAKNIDVFDETCNEPHIWGPEYMAKCFSDLRTDCIKLAEEGSLSRGRYKAAKIFLKDALTKVASMDKVPASWTHCRVKEGSQPHNMALK